MGYKANGLACASVQLTEKRFQSTWPSYLQKTCKLDHSPAKPGHIRLHQTHLVNVHSQEALDHATILGDHCACDQVTIIWEEGSENREQRAE
jgi:hypothetical protein